MSNPVSSNLPLGIDSLLQDIAQITGCISYLSYSSCYSPKPDFYSLAAKYITDLTMEEMQKVIEKKRTIIDH